VTHGRVRAKFERLAKLGHQRAAEWLKKEGAWDPTSDVTGSQTAISHIYDYVYPLSTQVSGSYGDKLDWKGIGPKPW
jgi:hypothetical protein